MRYILLMIFSLLPLAACTAVANTPTSMPTRLPSTPAYPTATLPPTPTPTLPLPTPTSTPEWGIAFAAVSPDMTTGPGPVWPLSLHLIHRDGSGLMPLTGEMEYISNLTASPDGRYLLFAAYREDTDGDGFAGSIDLPHLYIASVQTGEVFTLTSGSTSMEQVAAWAPDGERIAFASSEVNANNRIRITESHTYLYVINRDGTGKMKLTPQEGWVCAITWSPTGEQIAFEQNGAVWIMNSDGSGLSKVADTVVGVASCTAQPVWSPDGSRIAFVAPGMEGKQDIFVANAAGAGLYNLTADPFRDSHPVWSPDGQFVAFVREGELYVIDTNTNTVEPVFHSPERGAGFPMWSPDGSQIVFISPLRETWKESLIIANLADNSIQQLHDNVWDRPAWVLMPTR